MDRHRLPRFGIALFLFLTVVTLSGWLAHADQPTTPATSAVAEHLSPYGLQGAVIAVAGDKPSDAAINRFIELAGGEKADVVVLALGSANADGVVEALKSKKTANIAPVALKGRTVAGDAPVVQALRAATGAWVISSDPPERLVEMMRDMSVGQALRDLRLRGGVVAASGTTPPLLGRQFAFGPATKKPTGPDAGVGIGSVSQGFDVLPGMVVSAEDSLALAAANTPGLVGVQIPEGSALVVRGRNMQTIGDTPVSFHLPQTPTRDARIVEAKGGKAKVDYNEMRRAAAARVANPQYPPKELPVPEVPNGTLVIVGGGGMPTDVTQKFVEAGGGMDGHLVVLPISMPDPITNDGSGFLKSRFKSVSVVKAREQKDLEDPKTLEIFKKATAIWFGGGRQWNFVDAYEGTKIPELMWDVLRRGGVIGGSSAGATIQGDYLARGAPGGPNIMMCEGYEKSLGFLPGVAIDQHFTQRNRFKDMTALVNRYPQFLGIALDEATAIVVKGHVADVMGRGTAHFYDRRKPVVEGQPDYEALKAGGKYDLKERKILTTEAKK